MSLRKISVIIIISLIFTLTATSSIMAVEELVQEGRIAFHEGNYRQAEEVWLEVLEADNYNWEANFFLGMTYLRLNDYQNAADYMEDAYQIRSQDYSTIVNYARILYNQDEIDEARNILMELPAELRRSDEQYYNIRGLLAMAEENLDLAASSLEVAAEINPENYHVRNNLGLTLIRDNRYEEAIRHLEQAVEQEPEIAYIYNNLGVAYENLGRLQDARDAYEQALEIDPDYISAELNYDRVQSRLEN